MSYEKLNYMHRAAGRVCVLTSFIHTFGYIKKGLGKHGPGSLVFTTGIVAIVALFLMYITSFAIARRWFYEAFLAVHIAMCM